MFLLTTRTWTNVGAVRHPVVDLANGLIMNNHPGATTPWLRSKSGNPEGEVHIVQWASMEAEATGIAEYIKWLIDDRGDLRW